MKLTEEGTDSLFQQYTIKEIQDIERKLRNDIEKKKEDLRQMVGERYQDLMSAADTITDMKHSADKVTHHIKIMEQRCGNIYHQTTLSGILQSSSFKVAKELEPVESKYIVGAKMKILMDMPNMIWYAMDNGCFLRAAQLFLLSLHINSSLNFDFSKGINVLNQFPIVNNQISQIRKFRYTILRICRQKMKNENLTELELTDILCCLLFLDDVMPQALFEEFLEMRLNSIDSTLKLDKEDSSTKEQVCEVAELICNTIQLINLVFCQNGDRKNLLLETYFGVSNSSKEPLINLELSPVFSFLPDDIKHFKPKINQELPSITSEATQKTCLRWLENVVNLVQDKLKILLQYVNSVKGLSAICNNLDDRMNGICNEKWNEVCRDVFNKPFSPYEDMLKFILIERIKLIWDNSLEKAFDNCETRIKEVLKSLVKDNESTLEKDLTKYIWIESQSDLTIQPGWLALSSSETNLDGGILGLKSMGFTPQIQNLCKNLDEAIKELSEDVDTFGVSSNETNQTNTHKAEMSDLKQYTKNSTKIRVRKLLGFLNNFLDDNTEFSSLWHPFIGRFCHAMTELNICLKLCFSTSVTTVKEQEDWIEMKKEILDCSNRALRLWGVNMVSKEFTMLAEILISFTPTTLLETSLTWDEREISEETEDGKTVKSTIRVPMQASGYLQSTLHNICQSVNQTVGHTLPRDIVKELTKEIVEKFLKLYKSASEQLLAQTADSPRFTQTSALQLLFDVQWMNGLFGVAHPEYRAQIEELAAMFETLIDPFDLDVFNPVLKSNLTSAVHRSLLLVGLLSSERSGTISAQRLGPQNQPYNLLMANSGVGRFLLLPSSTKPEKRSPIDNVKKNPSQKMSRNYGSSPSLGAMSESDNVTKSYSFYDRFSAMGASWFGGSMNNP